MVQFHALMGTGESGDPAIVAGKPDASSLINLITPDESKKSPTAQFVRITNHGIKQILSLAEVQVFSGETNSALKGTATQHSTAFGGPPEYAIDGNTDGTFTNKSVTHTATVDNPWWELDLGKLQQVDKIVLWNRLEAPERLSGFTVELLDADRQTVMTRHFDSQPSPSLEIATDNTRGVAAMPQDEPPLALQEVRLIRQWIEQGAVNDSPTQTVNYSPQQPPTYKPAAGSHLARFFTRRAVVGNSRFS